MCSRSFVVLFCLVGCAEPSVVPEVAPVIETIAGSNGATASFADGVGTDARFASPEGLLLDPSGEVLYVADSENHAIRRIDLSTMEVTTVAGVGSVRGHDSGHLESPRNLVFDPSGTGIYITDTGNFVIRHLELATGVLTAPFGTLGMAGAQDGVGPAARFGQRSLFAPWPGGLVVDTTGSVPILYVADSGNHTIRAIDLATHEVTTIAGTVGVIGASDGPSTMATFNKPTGLALGPGRTLVVAEANNIDVRSIDLDAKTVATIAGKAPANPRHFCENISPLVPEECGDSDARRGIDARFRFPFGLGPDGAGGVYIADSHSNLIRHLDLTSTEVTTVAGIATEVLDDIPHASTDSSKTAPGTFWHPTHVVFAPPDVLYVADRSANCVRRVLLPLP